MNVQPKPSPAHAPASDRIASDRAASAFAARPEPRGRVPAAGPRLVFTWPVEFEVEPWRP
jgi:hypothetical protein